MTDEYLIEMAESRQQEELQQQIERARAGLPQMGAAPKLGPATCPNCSTRNDRMREGYEWCSACAEDPTWHLAVEAS